MKTNQDQGLATTLSFEFKGFDPLNATELENIQGGVFSQSGTTDSDEEVFVQAPIKP